MIAFTIPGEPQGKGRAKIVKIGGFSRWPRRQKHNGRAMKNLVAHVRALETDHGPGGWPAVEMATLSKLADEIDLLRAALSRLVRIYVIDGVINSTASELGEAWDAAQRALK